MRYNPYVPQILGQEWVAIRDETLILNPTANTLERGYTFNLGVDTTINNVRFYLKDWPELFASSMVYTASIYPAGQEASSGPIRSVIVPTAAVQVTGSGVSIFPTPTGTDPLSALYAPSDNLFMSWILGNGGGFPTGMNIFFNTNAYFQLLSGKRILGVDLLIGINMVNQGTEIEDIFQAVQTHVATDTSYDPLLLSDTFRLPDLITNRTPEGTRQIVRMHLGDANRFFGVTAAAGTAGVHNINQWTYPQLQRFEPSASQRLHVILTEGLSPAANLGPQVNLEYAALEVFYCEESRVLAGSRIFNDDIPNRPLRESFALGMNPITVRDQRTLNENVTLTAGTYTVTISESNMGDNYYAAIYRTVGELNEIRQLYSLPTLQGLQVNIPFPLNEEVINETFTSESTDLIPQLTMHASGGAVVEYSHVYGQQSAGQVWGNNFVSQEVDDRNTGGSFPYSWVRYYARRFGATTVPLKLSSNSPAVSGTANSVEITPAQFDALDEIIDGWKEVTLQFPTAPFMGNSTIPNWRWTATGELAGNRWEVLGVTAPAVSGYTYQTAVTPWFNQVPAGQQLYLGTYGFAVSGAVINEDWLPQWGPYVSGSTPDNASDATIIFSQNMPTVTGFAVNVTSQALTGIGLNCGINPCGIPSRILYNRLTWGLPANTAVARDSFDRVAASGFGSADLGGAYTLSAAATDYFINGSVGVMNPQSTRAIATLNIGTDFDIQASFAISGSATNTARALLVGRFTDISNYYQAFIQTDSAGVNTIGIFKVVAAFPTLLYSGTFKPTMNLGNFLRFRFVAQGQFLRAKVWSIYTDEPDIWNFDLTDTSLPTGNGVGVGAFAGAVGAGPIMVNDLVINPPGYGFGYYELQRSDSITDWQTIMKATSPQVTGFNDFEARTDMSSSYRIRGVNVYEFPGPWSSTATVFLTSPGVSGSCLSNGEHVMIFTTNERQDGSSNLAYSNAWENEVEEGFNFPESGFTQLQPMFDRDFFVAFRPLERGGDQFTRTVLVNAAAISPPTLPGFRSLSDMAWADVPYICVRDEEGNRWFANVSVPSGIVQNRRRLYMATVGIVEVTDTPSPVDP